MPSPQTEKIRTEFPDLLTTSELAEKVGRSKRAVERWRKRGYLIPSQFTWSGTIKVWLYTNEDLKAARALVKTTEGK